MKTSFSRLDVSDIFTKIFLKYGNSQNIEKMLPMRHIINGNFKMLNYERKFYYFLMFFFIPFLIHLQSAHSDQSYLMDID